MTETPKRLGIIGCGSSGLITLKNAIDALPDWQICCFERSNRITGCWGHPPKGFVSTSTKYTTQFSCYPLFDAGVGNNPKTRREEFFRDDEFGRYLEAFADHFQLRKHIQLSCLVESITRSGDASKWALSIRKKNDECRSELFDAVVICTGLAAEAKSIEGLSRNGPTLVTSTESLESDVRESTVVVIGGGESAVDFANRLARSDLGNETYLSLRSGIRVSPRYHPIRGVPSDFLRNRLMLSISPALRNRIGEFFVRSRIRYERWFEKLFSAGSRSKEADREDKTQHQTLKRRWAMKLTLAAKDQLFNMFHNKSDDFLQAVADGRLKIIGAPVDSSHGVFTSFDGDETIEVHPDHIVPAIGYRSTIAQVSGGQFRLSEFYLGCVHCRHENVFAVGYARPIIGNIPSISEMQARYVCALLSKTIKRDADTEQLHRADVERLANRYGEINRESVYPVEMFPYCDHLARQLGCYPSRQRLGGRWRWFRTQLIPASTMHYDWEQANAVSELRRVPVYLPPTLIGLLLLIKPIDWFYRRWRGS